MHLFEVHGLTLFTLPGSVFVEHTHASTRTRTQNRIKFAEKTDSIEADKKYKQNRHKIAEKYAQR